MAKMKSAPKAPKKTASVRSWENFNKRLDEVKKHNAKITSDKKKTESLIKKAESKKQTLRK